MIVLRDPSDLPRIANPAIRELVALRFRQLNSPDAPDANGCFFVVEGGDAVSEIEEAAAHPILRSLFDDLPFGHPDFYPCSEILEVLTFEHTCIYEMVFISDDDGSFTSIWIPDQAGIDTNLLAMCRSFATPAVITP